ncbi:MFS transporter [Gordonia paraffinivorans]|uniref:MFS transporter n=1 Tax=Gordonia paraffinivorans TaxID=175628 RepID=UPI001445A39D|nr:MFS transporter [Gordonia paraffinivorans]
MTSDQRAAERVPAAVYIMACCTFLMSTSEFIIAGLLPDLAADFGISEARAGLTVTVFAFGMIGGAPLMALLTARVQRKVTLASSLVVFSGGMLVSVLTDDFWVLIAARFVASVATSGFWTVGGLVAADLAGPARRAGAIAIVQGGGMMANVVGVPLGSFAGQMFGWRTAFWALAALAVVAAAVVVTTVPRDRHERPRLSLRQEVSGVRSQRLWLVLATCVAVAGGTLSVFAFASPMLTGVVGLDASLVPVALGVFGVGATVGQITGGRLGNARPHRTAAIAMVATAVVTGSLLAFCGHSWAAVALLGLLGFTGMAAFPVLVSLSMHHGSEAPLLGAALPIAFVNVGITAGSFLAGVALESQLAARGPLVVGLAASLLALIPFAALLIMNARHRPDTRMVDATHTPGTIAS